MREIEWGIGINKKGAKPRSANLTTDDRTSGYSNKMRGMRWCGLPPALVVRHPAVSPPPPVKLPSKRWRDVFLRVWHGDPLRCPVCQNPMRVIAVIDDPRVVEQIFRHLGAWHDPIAGLSPPHDRGSYTYESCDDVDPTPDYENVLTD